MKGSPKLPSCGFSAQAVQALSACGERFAYVDILQNPDIRADTFRSGYRNRRPAHRLPTAVGTSAS
ncbi:glutaredoxin domain-containing protein [Enterobacter ludwigii]|uniref:glutaredoxin domain-containing protein n=1 Tax=Enterobacter ludwigii TaxID=299767 RepID=UPI0039BE89C0